MTNPIRGLFFPLSSIKLSKCLKVGDSYLDLKVSRKRGKYSGVFSLDGKAQKLSLERIDESQFCESFLHHFYFRTPDKEYGAPRKFFARLGFHKSSPLEMEYSEGKYRFSFVSPILRREIRMQFSRAIHLVSARGL